MTVFIYQTLAAYPYIILLFGKWINTWIEPLFLEVRIILFGSISHTSDESPLNSLGKGSLQNERSSSTDTCSQSCGDVENRVEETALKACRSELSSEDSSDLEVDGGRRVDDVDTSHCRAETNSSALAYGTHVDLPTPSLFVSMFSDVDMNGASSIEQDYVGELPLPNLPYYGMDPSRTCCTNG
ncbi:uncharacterized protein LOC127869877 [Dreissena polymorpha]|uniref:uncharacterized protein LOC127869877 n=1 Tax=Dreissena polymorpha TaxID=45954 RepID=UPI0022646B26|nr:uncharacterized protein LOC127869877 [Dreissena polymorpha]